MHLRYLISKFIKKIQLPAIINTELDNTSKIGSGSHIVKSKIGRYSYISNFCTVVNSEIGNFCSIADYCIIGGASHPVTWISTSPVFHMGKNILKKNFSSHEYISSKKTIIGHDVWIGNYCLIKGGVRIGNGAVIGMGSVLTKDVGEYEIWAGNPAKLIRKRFNDITVEQLGKSKWWEKSDEKIQQLSKHFNDINTFIKDNEMEEVQ